MNFMFGCFLSKFSIINSFFSRAERIIIFFMLIFCFIISSINSDPVIRGISISVKSDLQAFFECLKN